MSLDSKLLPCHSLFFGKGVVRGRERHVQGGLYLIVCYLMFKCFYSTRESEKERREKGSEKGERGKRERQRERGKRVCVCVKERERSHEEELNLLGFHDATREVERERGERQARKGRKKGEEMIMRLIFFSTSKHLPLFFFRQVFLFSLKQM